MRTRIGASAIVFVAISIFALLAYQFQHENVVRTGPIESHVANARNTTGVLHLLLVASEGDVANVKLCRAILTAHVLGYPTPILLKWNETLNDPMIDGKSHLSVTTAAADYFRSLAKDKANDLALVINDQDVLFQLPPSVLLERYQAINYNANEALLQWLGPAATAFNLSQDIIFGASKRCTPNKPYSIACYAVPDSPLPRDLYGNNTDTIIGYSKWSSLRQRFLNSGVAIGPISSMQLAFHQAEEMLAAPNSNDYSMVRSTERESDHAHGQAVWNSVFGKQEFQREVLRRKYLTKATLRAEQQRLQPLAMDGTVVNDRINPSFTHETMEHGSERENEYGIGLDYWSQLTQQTKNADGDIKSLYFNGSSISEQIGKTSSFLCPSRVKGRLPDDILRADMQGLRISGKLKSWSELPLYTNVCLDTVPVVIHQNNAKDAQKQMWDDLWISRLLGGTLKVGILRDSGRILAISNGQGLTWHDICPEEIEDDVLGGSDNNEEAKCNPDDPFVLGEGTEYIKHVVEDSLWPFQVFKSSPYRPPVVKIKQAPNAKLAPGLLFITLYNTKAHSLKMPGPMIFTDQGRLVWFGPIGNTANFRTQTLNGKPTLVFWMRDGPSVTARGYGNITFLEQDYSVKKVLCPQYSLNTGDLAKPHCEADLHEAHIIPSRNTILTTAYNITPADLSSFRGPTEGWILDSQFYEIDPITKEVLFHWRATDHIPLSESRQPLRNQGSLARPYDYFHINSVVDIGEHYLLSSRHCWTIYLLSKTGEILWRFAGDEKGDFGTLPPEAQFRYQHDARPHNIQETSLDISLFDNGNWHINQKEPTRPSKLLIFRLPLHPTTNPSTPEILKIIHPQEDLFSVSQGSYSLTLPGDTPNTLATFGNIPLLIEFSPSAQQLWSAEFGRKGEAHIYRGYKQLWHATPFTNPDLFVEEDLSPFRKRQKLFRGYVSWNGATEVESWRIYVSGTGIEDLSVLGEVRKKGFETSFRLPCWTRFVRVGAVEGGGKEVRRSKVFQVR